MKDRDLITMRIRFRSMALTLRSTVFIMVILVATLLMIDCYKWHRFTLSWHPTQSLEALVSGADVQASTAKNFTNGECLAFVPENK